MNILFGEETIFTFYGSGEKPVEIYIAPIGLSFDIKDLSSRQYELIEEFSKAQLSESSRIGDKTDFINNIKVTTMEHVAFKMIKESLKTENNTESKITSLKMKRLASNILLAAAYWRRARNEEIVWD